MRITCWLTTCCLVVASCDRTRSAKPDTATAAVQESPGALASRHEAQECLDSARVAFIRKDYEGCITRLAEAAAFFREHSRVAERDARPALDAAAEEVETFLANVAKGRDRTVRDLDRVSAQANSAEAEMHLSNAQAAMIAGDSVRAGEELVMSIDHLERAARDAHRPRDSAVRRAVAGTRPLAVKLIGGKTASADEVSKATRAIEAASHRILESIEIPRLTYP